MQAIDTCRDVPSELAALVALSEPSAFPAPVTGNEPSAASAPAAASEVRAPNEEPATPAVAANHWTARLLVPADDAPGALGAEARRLASGLGLSAIFGLAAGARHGGLAFATSAALVPAALLGACAFGLPALYIALGMVDAPLAPRRLFGATSRAVATSGLVLAGLAPVAALYVVSSSSQDAASFATFLGLAAGSLAGLRSLWRDVAHEMRASKETIKVVTVGAMFGFALFAAAVGCRVWMHLPIFGATAVR